MSISVNNHHIRSYGPAAAVLIAQIDYWLTKAAAGRSRFVVDRGSKWVALSREKLKQETGLTDQQIRTALSKLRSSGVLRSERHLFQNKTIAHFQIDYRRLINHSDSVEKTTTGEGQIHTTGEGQKTPTIYKTKDLSKNKKDYGSVKTEQFREEKDMGSVNDILAGKLMHKGETIKPEDAVKPTQLAEVFRNAWAEMYPENFLPSFTAKHLGQLGQIKTKVPKGKVGEIIDHAVRNWEDVVSTAKAQQSAFNCPQLPDLGFIMKFAQSATASWKDALPMQLTALPKPRKDFTPEKPLKTAPKGEMASLEEVEKLMNGGL